MKKRICLLLAILILCFSATVFAQASAENYYADEPVMYYAESTEDYQTEEFFSIQRLAASLISGYVIGFLIIWSIASKNKSVRMQANATEYTRQGSLVITGRSDNFLYTDTQRTAKPKRDDKK